MENIAPSGVACISTSLGDLPDRLLDSATSVQISRRYYGQAVRTDRWSCRNLARAEHMLYLVLEGEIRGAVADHPFQLGPGTLFWLSPFVPHDMAWPSRLVFTELWFRLSRDGRDLRLSEPALVLEGAGETISLFRQIEDELSLGGPYAEQRLRHLLALLTIDIARLHQPAAGERRLNPAQRRQLLAFVRQHLADRPSIDELAGAVELSPDYFSRVFTRTFGMPPRDWLVQERIREAARMLSTTTLTVYQVAEQLGYVNVSQFSRQFREQVGQPPRRYRARHTT